MINKEKSAQLFFWLLLCFAGLSLFACSVSAQEVGKTGEISNLKRLYDQKKYFELRGAVKNYQRKTDADFDFFQAAVANKFNKPRISLDYIRKYLKRTKNKETTLAVDSYELLADNYRKIYQYKKAAEAYNAILTDFRNRLTANEIKDYENLLKLWGALKDVSPQSASFKGSSAVQTFRNQADLINIPATVNNQNVDLVFDTGANISSVTATYAKKLGLKIIETGVDIGSSTGEKSKAKLGIAERVEIGNVTVRNVVFLIFDDSALYISPLSLQLNGYIGFPLMEALREITLSRSGELRIPAKPGSRQIQNMCLEGLAPLIEGEYKGEKLIFSLDTGANTSDLYPPFYKAYEQQIKANYPSRISNRAGVGSSTAVTAYYAKNLIINFAGKDANFPQIAILPAYTTGGSRYFYGNLGQDFVKQFQAMTLNFDSMSISLK